MGVVKFESRYVRRRHFNTPDRLDPKEIERLIACRGLPDVSKMRNHMWQDPSLSDEEIARYRNLIIASADKVT